MNLFVEKNIPTSKTSFLQREEKGENQNIQCRLQSDDKKPIYQALPNLTIFDKHVVTIIQNKSRLLYNGTEYSVLYHFTVTLQPEPNEGVFSHRII